MGHRTQTLPGRGRVASNVNFVRPRPRGRRACRRSGRQGKRSRRVRIDRVYGHRQRSAGAFMPHHSNRAKGRRDTSNGRVRHTGHGRRQIGFNVSGWSNISRPTRYTRRWNRRCHRQRQRAALGRCTRYGNTRTSNQAGQGVSPTASGRRHRQ